MAEIVPAPRDHLGAKLRELRARRHRSGSALARALDWGQSKVSKLERGAQLPSEEDLASWSAATEASDADRAELADLLAAARVSYRTWAPEWTSPERIADVEDEIAGLEQRATTIREYQPALVPGLAATGAYRRALLSVPGGASLLGADTDGIEAKVAAMLRRQQNVLYQPGRTIRLLMGEAALHTRFSDDPDVLAGQRDRLATLEGLTTVDIGILPFTGACPVLPLANFTVLDDRSVVVETTTGEQLLQQPEEVEVYARAFEIAWDAATTGDDAVAMLRAVHSARSQ